MKGKDVLILKQLKIKKDKQIIRLANQNNRKDIIILKDKSENLKLKNQIKMMRQVNRPAIQKKVMKFNIEQQTEESKIVEDIMIKISRNIVKRKQTIKMEE